MLLLRVTASLNPAAGGVTTAVNLTTFELRKLGVEVELACSDDPDAAWLADRGDVHAFGPGKFGWSFSSHWRPWLRRNLSRFDAVTIEGLWQYPSWATAKACQSAKKPFFAFPHGMLDPWFQEFSHRPLKAIRNILYWKLYENTVINRAVSVFFTCEQEKVLARKPFRPYRPRREVVVGLGTSAPPPVHQSIHNAFSEKCPNLGDSPYLLFLSRIHPKKGVDLLIKAYATLREIVKNEKGEGEGFELPLLVIAGPGLDTSYGRKCLKLCEDLGLSCAIPSATSPSSDPFPSQNENDPVVFFPGLLQGDAKWGAFYGCEAFVLPSHQENFGIVVAEALGCGKPVLISNQVNIWREVKEAGAGLVAEDAESGTRELLRTWLQMTPEAKDRMRTAAQPCFTKNFRVEASADAILRVLRSDQR